VTGPVAGAPRVPGAARLLGPRLRRSGQQHGEVGEFGQQAASGVLPVRDDQGGVRATVSPACRPLTGAVAGVGVGVTGGQVIAVISVTEPVSDRLAVVSPFLGVVLAGAPSGAFGP